MKTPPHGQQPSLHGQAIKLLARREHSRAELAKKLSRKLAAQASAAAEADAADEGNTRAAAQDNIDNVLDQLEQSGLLSDARAADAYVRSHAARFGTARLSHSLRTRGIDPALIEASLAQDGIEGEMTRAAAVWRGKFAGKPHDVREWARQARFLQSRGFSTDIIRKLLKEMPEASEEHDE